MNHAGLMASSGLMGPEPSLFVTARQVSDYNCERALLSSLPTGVLTAIVNGHKQKDIEQLLPWNYAA